MKAYILVFLSVLTWAASAEPPSVKHDNVPKSGRGGGSSASSGDQRFTYCAPLGSYDQCVLPNGDPVAINCTSKIGMHQGVTKAPDGRLTDNRGNVLPCRMEGGSVALASPFNNLDNKRKARSTPIGF